MPRLILIDGPRSGEWVQLRADNYLGFTNGQLAFSHLADIQHGWIYLRSLPQGTEIHNMGGGARVLLNNSQFQRALVRHGDVINMHDSTLIYDADDSDASGSGVVSRFNRNRASSSQVPVASMPSQSTNFPQLFQGEGEDLLASMGSGNANEQVQYRVKYRDHDEMMGAVKDAQRMKVLLKVSSKLNNIDLADMLNDMLEIIFEAIPADRGAILLFDPARRRFRNMASKTRGGGEAKVRISRTIAKEVLRTKESILSADAQADDRFDLGMSIVDEDIHSAVCCPILINDEIAGLVHLDTSDADRQFERGDCDLLTAICMQAALAVENSRLLKNVAEQERVKTELEVAATIQQQLLPRKLPVSSQLEVYGKMIPAKELGGDYFDFIDHGNGEFHICIGDVSGKGLPAGLVMVMARSYLRPLAAAHRAPRKVMCEANRLLFDDTRRDMFMSALLLYWSDAHQKFLWCGAGHEHLLVYRARTRSTEAIKAGGLVMAMMRDADRLYQERELELETGDALVLYTDGVTEAQSPQQSFFAEESLDPLIDLVNRYGHLSAKDLLEAMLWELRNFMGDAPQADDITMVTIKKL